MNSTWYRVKDTYPWSPFNVGDRIEITVDKKIKVNGLEWAPEKALRIPPNLDLFPNIFKKVINGVRS